MQNDKTCALCSHKRLMHTTYYTAEEIRHRSCGKYLQRKGGTFIADISKNNGALDG